MHYAYLDSPAGPILVAGEPDSLRCISFAKNGVVTQPDPGWTGSLQGAVGEAMRQLREYFAGLRKQFDLPLAPEGTAFQKSVWRQLQQIPYGITISYGQLAKRVGNPNAARAVGSANGRNPLPIVIPCHRVIAGGGKLGGFSGGLNVKQILLQIESPYLQLPL